MPTPIQNFDGVNNINGVLPPDTNGDVGANHYMQWVNLSFAIWDKNCVAALRRRSREPRSSPGDPHCGTANSGDPVTIYDQYAGRWIAGQFVIDRARPTTCASRSRPRATRPALGAPTSSSSTRRTSPTTRSSASGRPERVHDDRQPVPAIGFGGVGIWAFERDQMIASASGALRLSGHERHRPYLPSMLPADADGDTPPPTDAPAPFVA